MPPILVNANELHCHHDQVMKNIVYTNSDMKRLNQFVRFYY